MRQHLHLFWIAAIPLTAEEEAAAVVAAKAGDRLAVDALIRSAARIIQLIAGRLGGRGVDRDDLVQVGLWALVRAIDSYEPGESRFITWAARKAEFAMREELRTKAGLIQVPREAARQMKQAGTLGVYNAGILSLNRKPPFARSSWAELVGSKAAKCPVDREAVRLLVRTLDGKMAQVVALRFGIGEMGYGEEGAEYDQAQIARIMNISPSRVSQLLALATQILRSKWNAEEEARCIPA